jgi:hypothetical protein
LQEDHSIQQEASVEYEISKTSKDQFPHEQYLADKHVFRRLYNESTMKWKKREKLQSDFVEMEMRYKAPLRPDTSRSKRSKAPYCSSSERKGTTSN